MTDKSPHSINKTEYPFSPTMPGKGIKPKKVTPKGATSKGKTPDSQKGDSKGGQS